MAVVRWQFTDTVTSDSYTFEINPKEGGSPAYQRNLQSQRTTSGALLIMEGTQQPQTLQFNGTILTQSHYEAFDSWSRNRHILQLTDDLGRSFNVLITDWSPSRVYSAHFPWKHTYTMTAQVVD